MDNVTEFKSAYTDICKNIDLVTKVDQFIGISGVFGFFLVRGLLTEGQVTDLKERVVKRIKELDDEGNRSRTTEASSVQESGRDPETHRNNGQGFGAEL